MLLQRVQSLRVRFEGIDVSLGTCPARQEDGKHSNVGPYIEDNCPGADRTLQVIEDGRLISFGYLAAGWEDADGFLAIDQAREAPATVEKFQQERVDGPQHCYHARILAELKFVPGIADESLHTFHRRTLLNSTVEIRSGLSG
jgi:hypothetical protein